MNTALIKRQINGMKNRKIQILSI